MRFRLFGTEIYISFLFAATVTALLLCDRTGFLIPTLLAVLCHELGHLAVMCFSGCAPKSVRLVPASVQIIRPFCPKAGAEIGIALAGPAANLCAALSCFMLFFQSGHAVWQTHALLHLLVCGFNLLPVSGLDGGTVLRELLLRRCSLLTVCRIMKAVTVAVALLLAGGGIWLYRHHGGNYSLLITAIYLLLTAVMTK